MSSTAWPEVPLGEVATFVRGVTFKPDDVVAVGTPGSVACMRTKNVQSELDLDDVWGIPREKIKRNDQHLLPGDVLVSSANSWNLVGKCSWVSELPWPSTFGGFVTALRSTTPLLDSRYLYRWFSEPRVQATIRSFGRSTTNISNLSLERCRATPVPMPPIEEQRRIAAVLDKADELRAKRCAALALLDTLTESIFLEMFGDPLTNPMGWPVAPFGEVCPSHLGKMLDQKRQTGNSAAPYLRNANVRWFGFDLTDVAAMDFGPGDRERYRLIPGDVLICEGGEPGRAAVWKGELGECYFQKALHRARPLPDRVLPDYVVRLLANLATRGGLVDHISTATIAHLTGERLKRMPIPVPTIGTQTHFVERVQAVESGRSNQRYDLAQLDELFASLQDRAFRGEL